MAEETKEILNAILHRLNTLDANVEGIKNDLSQFRSETNQNFAHVDRQFRLFDSDMEMLNKKVAEHDRDINRLKQVNGI
ncbi:hypothetical protein EPH95_12570 [Salicibibacter halophilus]|uniref:Uncharacterized protein n=1 Tax=Salicibibacter halophilus TaxID=2502791 RepID=A0A514LJ83_9BACI|nr:hypothetical protein [Salicibibacter halophilus]QDI91908.1 hypothetical protein EPH95_12570 [Salicibibacter halophilus]